jgi:superfamily II DNA or RNA helicase
MSINVNDTKRVYKLIKRLDKTSDMEEHDNIRMSLLKMKKASSTHPLEEHVEYFFNKYQMDSQNEQHDVNETFTLTLNQRFIKKFMSINTRNKGVLLFHGVGVGKTCTAIQIAENFSNVFDKCILIMSKLLKANFRKEIFSVESENGCVGDKYKRRVQNYHKLEKKDRTRKVQQEISKYYDFNGYQEFANILLTVKKKSTDIEYEDYVKTNYSNKLIIIDEVHNIRTTSDKEVKKIPIIINDIIRIAQGVRLVYLSATPMYNDPNEILWLMSSLMANSKIPEPKKLITRELFNGDEIQADMEKELLSFSKLHVSYMRGENPNTFPIRLYPESKRILEKEYPKNDVYGERINESSQIKYVVLTKSEFSEEQYAAYSIINYKDSTDDSIKKDADASTIKKDAKEKKENKEKDNEFESNDSQTRIQLSNIYFPVNVANKILVGKKGLLTMMNEHKSKSGYQLEYKDDVPHIFDVDNIATFSPKIKTIIDLVKNAEGIVIIYSKYIYSGILPMAMVLESCGFSRFNRDNVLKTKQGKPVSTGKHMGNYTILTGDSEISPNKNVDIDAIRSFENRNGDTVKVVIISQVATEGIDFKNVREIHILEPWYNMSKIEQIIGRGVRNRSHINLPESKRNVSIFQHANVFPKKVDERESVDFRMYRISQNKQLKISKIERVLKQGSVDCNLNKAVLYFDPKILNKTIDLITSQRTTMKDFSVGDKDFTRLCDFEKCNIECVPTIPTPKTEKNHQYNRDLLKYDIDALIVRIKMVFVSKGSIMLSFDDIKSAIGVTDAIRSERNTLLYHALNEMIQSRLTFEVNKVNGFLIYKSDKYFFQPLWLDDQKTSVDSRIGMEPTKKVLRLQLKYIPTSLKEDSENISDDDMNAFNDLLVEKISYLKHILHTAMNIDQDDIDRTILWSIIVDSFDKNELDSFIRYVNRKIGITDENLILSLRESNAFVLNGSQSQKTINVFYDPFEEKFKIVDNLTKTIKAVSRIDNAYYKSNMVKTITPIVNDHKQSNRPLFGFIEINSKKGTSNFKIANKETLLKKSRNTIIGSVCSQSSEFNKEIMKKYINDTLVMINVDPKTVSIQSMKKNDRCVFYEYLLRTHKLHFMRPMHYITLRDSNK